MIRDVRLWGVDCQLLAAVHIVFPNGEVVELPCEFDIDRGVPLVKMDTKPAVDMIHRAAAGSRRLGGRDARI